MPAPDLPKRVLNKFKYGLFIKIFQDRLAGLGIKVFVFYLSYDLLRGDEPYKTSWKARRVQVYKSESYQVPLARGRNTAYGFSACASKESRAGPYTARRPRGSMPIRA